MSLEIIVQFLILAATAVLFWTAKRDLTSRALKPLESVEHPNMEELEQLCSTLESLVTDLSRRLTKLEQRFSVSEQQLWTLGQQFSALELESKRPKIEIPQQIPSPSTPSSGPVSPPMSAMPTLPALLVLPSVTELPVRDVGSVDVVRSPPTEPGPLAPDPRYAPVFALLAEGVTNAEEVVRRTGLSRGEVDLILGLHARKVF